MTQLFPEAMKMTLKLCRIKKNLRKINRKSNILKSIILNLLISFTQFTLVLIDRTLDDCYPTYPTSENSGANKK